MQIRLLRLCLLIGAVALVPACGGGGGGSAGTPAGPPGADSPPAVSVVTPAGSQSGLIAVAYRLLDAESAVCTLNVAVSSDGGVTYVPATPGPGGDGLVGLASSPAPGTLHSFVWNSAANGVGLTAVANVRLRFIASDAAAGAASSSGDFTVVNRFFTPPSAAITTPAGPQSGNVSLSYALSDAESDPCSLLAQYSTDGGATWTAATAGPGGDGVASLASSPAGSAHVFVWNSVADAVALTPAPASVRFRVTPSDGGAGTPALTSAFVVSNRTFNVPSASVSTPAGIQSGNVVVSYSLFDAESDPCSILVQYSLDAGATFLAAAAGPGGDGVAGLAASPAGSLHTFVWNSVADGVAAGLTPASVRLRITPSDPSAGAAGTSGAFTVNNRPFTPPSATISTPAGVVSGLVTISYALIDAESDPCGVQLMFSLDGGASYAFATAGPGGDGVSGLAASPSGSGGVPHSFLWNSVADGVGLAAPATTLRIRVIPDDGAGGVPADTANFVVDNAGAASGSSIVGFPVLIDPTAQLDAARSVASDGSSLYVFGFSGLDLAGAADASWRLEKRRCSDGGLVAGFPVLLNPGPGFDLPVKVLLDGTFVFLVGIRDDGGGVFSVQVRKLNASDGTPVAGFGTAGVLTGPSAGSGDGIPLAWTAALDGSSLYLAGPQRLSATESCWRIEKRDKLSGAPDGGFGTAGAVTQASNGLIDGCFGLVLDASSMWVVGTTQADAGISSNSKIRIQKRSLSTGALVAGFGTGGQITIDAGPGDDLAEDAVRDASFLYVYSRVETGFATGVFSTRLDKLDLATGASAASLSGLGGLDPTGELPCRHLAIDGSDLYIASADNGGDVRWRVEKRRASTLAVVTAFAGSGVKTANPSAGDDRPLDLLVQGGVLYVVGSDSVAGGGRWRIEAWWK